MGDFNSTRVVRARKDHRCEECNRGIEVGERYWRTAAVWEGEFFRFVSCDHCHHARNLLRRAFNWDPEDLSYGGMYETLMASRHDATSDLEAVVIYRLIVGIRDGWQTRTGARIPARTYPNFLLEREQAA